MVFIPRDPVLQNQFLAHDTGNANTTATAGSVVCLTGDELVQAVSGTTEGEPYGFLMQTIKAESSAHPTGFRLPGDLGSSDAFTGDPVAVAHFGIYDTTHYSTSDTYTAGDNLGVDNSGQVCVSTGKLNFSTFTTVGDDIVAVAQNSLSAAQVAAGEKLRIKLLI